MNYTLIRYIPNVYSYAAEETIDSEMEVFYFDDRDELIQFWLDDRFCYEKKLCENGHQRPDYTLLFDGNSHCSRGSKYFDEHLLIYNAIGLKIRDGIADYKKDKQERIKVACEKVVKERKLFEIEEAKRTLRENGYTDFVKSENSPGC